MRNGYVIGSCNKFFRIYAWGIEGLHRVWTHTGGNDAVKCMARLPFGSDNSQFIVGLASGSIILCLATPVGLEQLYRIGNHNGQIVGIFPTVIDHHLVVASVSSNSSVSGQPSSTIRLWNMEPNEHTTQANVEIVDNWIHEVNLNDDIVTLVDNKLYSHTNRLMTVCSSGKLITWELSGEIEHKRTIELGKTIESESFQLSQMNEKFLVLLDGYNPVECLYIGEI